jgi:exopolysaccharide biosynthesis polyprenyl glycosylphosphotransferase
MDRPLRDWRRIAKEIEDRVLAAAILTLISPLMLVIACLIKLDSPGPVFFRQKRYGFNNELIEVLKFRTMYDEARDDNAEQLTRRNDPRVTRLGAFLRRTSIDELPQFFNVLRGEMSIVGPRPHALAAKAGLLLYQDAVGHYDARHRMKPGITGWAQVNGWRGETDTIEQIRRRVEHDLYYIENWSIRLDLAIILRTIFGGFTGRYAY